MLLKAWTSVESKSNHSLLSAKPKVLVMELRFSNKGLSPDMAGLINSSFHMLLQCTKLG